MISPRSSSSARVFWTFNGNIVELTDEARFDQLLINCEFYINKKGVKSLENI